MIAGEASWPPIRRATDPRVNLSSNELLHPDLADLLEGIGAALQLATVRAYPELRSSVATLARYTNRDVSEILLTPGSDSALRFICRRHVAAGGYGLILQDPNYPAWVESASETRLNIVRVPFLPDRPEEQVQLLLIAATQNEKCLLVVSNPNGPTGTCIGSADLDLLTELCVEHNHTLVIDSCYEVFNASSFGDTAIRAGGNVVVVQSLSKSHGLAGARVSMVFADPRWLGSLNGGWMEQAVSGPSLCAALFAIEQHDALTRIWSDVREARGHAELRLRSMGCYGWTSGGNFVVANLGSAKKAGDTVMALSARGFRVRDLSSLPNLAGNIRFTVVDDRQTSSFMNLLEKTLDGQAQT